MDYTAKRFVSIRCMCTFSVVFFVESTAHAIDVATVPVGNPGNSRDPVHDLDPRGTFGAVDYPYRIGEFEVTNAEYAHFLNAVATADTHALYHPEMGNDPRGGILRSGADGSFSYDVKPNMGNKPVNYISFWDATRFANWLHNGQPTGGQDDTSTENGAYTLNGVTTSDDGGITRNPAARWFIPSEDEWYKAAYHHPRAEGGDADDYWFYAMATPLDPVAATANAMGDIDTTAPHTANHLSSADWNGLDGNVTSVGSAGVSSESFYGTSDQSGNVSEWTEGLLSEGFSFRMVRGGSWESHFPAAISSAIWQATEPQVEAGVIGFRVAAFPEPIGFTPGDYNDNGFVEQADLDLVLLNWGSKLIEPSAAGWHNDLPAGLVDQEELDKVLLNWGSSAALVQQAGAAGVPEPDGMVLALLALTVALVSSRRSARCRLRTVQRPPQRIAAQTLASFFGKMARGGRKR